MNSPRKDAKYAIYLKVVLNNSSQAKGKETYQENVDSVVSPFCSNEIVQKFILFWMMKNTRKITRIFLENNACYCKAI